MQKKLNKRGAAGVAGMLVLGVMIVLAVVISVGGFMAYDYYKTKGEPTGTISTGGSATSGTGTVVSSLAVQQVNKYTEATEGSDDAEFWTLGADVTNTKLSAREVLDLSSGAVTDTSVPALRSMMTEKNMDLYVEGTGNYYDDKVPTWNIEYNPDEGKGVLNANGPSGALVATDVGTFADIDTAIAVDTGFAQDGAGAINYSIATGDGTAYIRLEIGNDEADSDLRDVVLCFGDDDSDLDANEFTAITVSKYSGESVGVINSNLLPLFSQSAGTGTMACQSIGSILGPDVKKGVYQFDFTITEANFEADEEFEIGLDDLGGWKARDYPSANLKATAEDLTVRRVA